MPRVADPRNEYGRRRTELYRAEQSRMGRPEASAVDRAAAAAVAASFAMRKSDAAYGAFLDMCADLLEKQGYDRQVARRKADERLQFRHDLEDLVSVISSAERSGKASL